MAPGANDRTARATKVREPEAAPDLAPIAPLLQALEARYHPEEVWLFGSRARGDARAESDWDLLLVVPDEVNDADLSPLIAWRIKRDAGIRADVVVYRASEFRDERDTVNTLPFVVAREGVRLRGR